MSKSLRYGLAVLSVVAALTVRLGLDPVLGPDAHLLIFTLSILAAARFGGRGPALMATSFSVALASFLFIQPPYSVIIVKPADFAKLGVLAVAGVAISLLVGRRLSAEPSDAVRDQKPWDAYFVLRTALLGVALVMFAALTHLRKEDRDRDRDYHQRLIRTYEISNASNSLISAAERAEAEHRNYLLTGDLSYLELFQSAVQAEQTAQSALLRLTVDDAAQQASLAAFDRVMKARLPVLRKAIAIRQTLGVEAAISQFRTAEGEHMLDQCRSTATAIDKQQHSLMAGWSSAYESQSARMRCLLGLGTSSLLLLAVVAGAAIARDIRDRERSRQAVHKSEERLRLALDSANAGAWEWDLRTRRKTWSDETWKLYGLTPRAAAPSYQEWLQLVHPDDREDADRVVMASAHTGSDMNVEFRIGDGTSPERWLLARARLFRDVDGQPERFIGIVLDITHRKLAEEALREREQNLRYFTEAAPVPIAMFDHQMRYLAASQRFRDDFRIGPQDLAGRSHYEIFPEIPDHWREIHRRCLTGAVGRSDGERFVRRDGTEQWVRWEIQPWRKVDQEIGGIVMFAEDITRQKQAEMEVRSLNLQLEQRVSRRTAELEAANKELEAFSYSVSHDLRAPLRGIDGWSLALLEDFGDLLPEPGRHYLARVRSETARMGLLIEDLLQLSRVASSEMRTVRVDLTTLAKGVVAELMEATPGRRLEFRIEPELVAPGDPRLLRIVLTNLLSNAVKFTTPRDIAKIEFGRAANGSDPAFCVRDNGVGFDMAYAGALFGAFQRLHKASEFPGTGIGLAIVQRVIHRHAGRVWTEAQRDGGANFYFTIGIKS